MIVTRGNREKSYSKTVILYIIEYIMMLNREEKEQRVIELYKQGRSIREIAYDVHMSFGDIGAIIKKLTGVNGDKPKEQNKALISALSKDSSEMTFLVIKKQC